MNKSMHYETVATLDPMIRGAVRRRDAEHTSSPPALPAHGDRGFPLQASSPLRSVPPVHWRAASTHAINSIGR